MTAIEDVIIVGAGVAGLSAALALNSAGCKPLLLERRPCIGGRAYSYAHPTLEEVIDSQHVLLGCCTQLVDLCRQTGADKHLRWYDSVPFLEPQKSGVARRSDLHAGLGPSASLAFLRAPMLTLADKLAIARGLTQFLSGYPQHDDESFAAWLQRTRQPLGAIRHFWEPVVVATLNDSFDRCSTKYAGQVFYEAFLKSAQGGRMAIPTQPLSTFYSSFARKSEEQGTRLQLRASVDTLTREASTWLLTLSDASTIRAKDLILALPFEQTQRLLATAALPNQPAFARFTHSPITTIHLWFDRDILAAHPDLDHCALLDTRIQWLFNKSRIRRDEPGPPAHYLELVISASHAELHQTREEILANALRELALFFPAARHATLLKSGILKEARATFSVTPGLDKLRPRANALGHNLFLAGDWTATGWPSTMEGAARSGRLAAQAITGRNHLAPDLPATGLARLF
jgi:squalene-associated FAD-dependent desaturase